MSRGIKDCIDICLELLRFIKYLLKCKMVLEQLKLENYMESAETLEEDADNNTAPAKSKKFSKMR